MTLKQIDNFTLATMKWVIKIVKPWKKNPAFEMEGKGQGYADGWNDCIKEMARASSTLLKTYRDKTGPFEKIKTLLK